MSDLLPLALTAESLLRAIIAHPQAKSAVLAEASGRNVKHIARDLESLATAGLYDKTTATLTPNAHVQLAMLDRARETATPAALGGVLHAQILPSGLNPRRDWDSPEAKEALAELAESIAREGLLQNLVVRPDPHPTTEFMRLVNASGEVLPYYELVAGERRFRAIAVLIADGRWPETQPIPVKIVDLDAAGHARVALIENLKRRDLKPLEEARAFAALRQGDEPMTTAQIAEAINSTQRLVQQRLQLLELSEADQKRLDAGKLTIEQARSIVANRPVQPQLSPIAWLLLAEMIDAGARAKTSLVDVGPGHAENAAIAELKLARLVYGPWPKIQYGAKTGEYVQVSYSGKDALLREYPAFDKARQETLKILRAAALGDLAEPLEEGVYATPWLNGPFEPSAEAQAQIAAAKASEDEKNKKREDALIRRREDFNAARTATLDLQSFANVKPPEPLHAQVKPLAEQMRTPVPWRFRPQHNWRPMAIIAANGAEVMADDDNSAGVEACFRLIIVSVNAAAGMATPEDIEVEGPGAVKIVDLDAALEDDDEDEDETNLEEEDA